MKKIILWWIMCGLVVAMVVAAVGKLKSKQILEKGKNDAEQVLKITDHECMFSLFIEGELFFCVTEKEYQQMTYEEVQGLLAFYGFCTMKIFTGEAKPYLCDILRKIELEEYIKSNCNFREE
jgi:hypothetical protein